MNAIGITQNPRRQRVRARRRSIGRFTGLAVLAACASLLAAACSSSPSSSGSGGSGANANAPAFTTTASWGPASWSYNPWVPAASRFEGFGVLLPLAMVQKTTNQDLMFNMIPQLMSSYSLSSGNVMTIHLVPGAKFSDGEPVNATDLVNTVLLNMVAESLVYEQNVANVTAVNSTTVDIDFTANTANVNVRGSTLALTPVPMSQYGQFLPSGMEQTLLAYNKLVQNPKTAATAQSSPLYAKIAADNKKLLSYAPPKLIGDGPFMLTGVNTSSASEVKSPTYYGASNVHVDKLNLLNSGSATSTVYPQLFSHDLDWYGAATPSSAELSQWKSTSGAQYVMEGNDTTENMLFNNKVYPFTLTAVRQAMAYLINRTTVASTEDGGTLTSSQPDTLPDGLSSLLNSVWLTSAQQAQLNTYPNSPSKATALLEGAGFKKSGSQWMMPNGKPFTTQVIAPSTPGSAALAAKEWAAELTAFGITATASAEPATSYSTLYQDGKFQIAWIAGNTGNLEPICGIATGGFGAPANYTFGTNGAATPGEPGEGFGPTYDVPGLGKVPVSYTIDLECQQTQAGPKMASLAWDWAQLDNQQVPFLSYAYDNDVVMYSTYNYTNWPSASSWLWQEAGIFPVDAIQLMIEQGYLSPKS